MRIRAFSFASVVIFISTCTAQKCPANSIGKYPSCKCTNGGTYSASYNWCTNDLKQLSGDCPEDGPGIYPNCNCGLGKTFVNEKKVCIEIDKSVCPKGATGSPPNCNCGETFAFDDVHWYCRPWYLSTTTEKSVHRIPHQSCPPHQYGIYPDCHYKPCPYYSVNPKEFEPNCTYNYTRVDYKTCPKGEVGYPPNCHKPCPAYHVGIYPDCVKMKCPKALGWSGEYMPDCKHTPTCPPEFPGVWPKCDIYKATKATTQSHKYLPPKKATVKPKIKDSTHLLPNIKKPTTKALVTKAPATKAYRHIPQAPHNSFLLLRKLI